jgi:hypothetical protein
MLKARATTLALGIALVFVAVIGTAGPARADHGFGFRHHPFFFHNHFFSRDRFFFGLNGVGFPAPYPLPPAAYYPPAYYPPPSYYRPPPPSYYPPPPPSYYPPPPPPPSYYPPDVTGASPQSHPQLAERTPPQAATQGNCRNFEEAVTLEGRSVMAYGTRCQQSDGTWRVTP